MVEQIIDSIFIAVWLESVIHVTSVLELLQIAGVGVAQGPLPQVSLSRKVNRPPRTEDPFVPTLRGAPCAATPDWDVI